MVDRHGFAPCSPACGAGDLLNDRAAQEKLVAGAGVEPAHRRLMRPLPSHLAPPRFEKWHGASVLPRARGVLETLLRKLAPAVSMKMVRSAGIAPASPDWHSGILLLDDDRE